MQLSALILATLSLSARVFAQDVVSCGRNEYTYDQIEEAAEEACRLFDRGQQLGRNNYPHRYNNFEGFEFDNVRGPYQEFPLLRRGSLYTGGSPGPDRVIITENCDLAGQITHTGASRNGFVDCDDAISVRTERNSSSSGSNDSNDSSSSNNSNNNNGGSSNSDDDDDSGSSRLVSGAGALLVGSGAMMLAIFV